MRGHVNILPADNGDSIMVRFLGKDNDFHNILIDGGRSRTYRRVIKQEVREIKKRGEKLDLVVVTHIDDDHIGGILALIRDKENIPLINKFWFNSGIHFKRNIPEKDNFYEEIFIESLDNKISIRQGITLESFLKKNGQWHLNPILQGQRYDFYGAEVTILSPSNESLRKICGKFTAAKNLEINNEKGDLNNHISDLAHKEFREDSSISNGSSIAFLLKIYNTNILFPSDAHPTIIIKSLMSLGFSRNKKLKIDYFVVPHHGSKGNLNYELLELIHCNNFIISTNGKNKNLPHKTTLSRIICNPSRSIKQEINFLFNYNHPPLTEIFTQNEMSEYYFKCYFPQDSSSLKFEIK